MAGIGDFFSKGSIGEQLLVWQVLGQVVGAAMTPGITEVQAVANEAAPVAPLSPSELAVLVQRHYIDTNAASDDAAKSGINQGRFDYLVNLAGTSPGVAVLVEALRRKIIGEGGEGEASTSFAQGLRESGLSDKWEPILRELAVQIPSIAEVMNAWLEGQIEEGEAHDRYIAAGGDPTWFQTSYNANGQAPTPMQALELWNRGIIPEGGRGPEAVSYEQAFLEGPWRNKWLPAFKALRVYVPPPRTVTAMLRSGTLTEGQAMAYFQASGLSPESAAQYVADASHHATAAARALSQSQTITLYRDKLLTAAEAVSHLVSLRYSQADAELLVHLADFESASTATRQAVSRIQSLYLSGKNDATTTLRSLGALGVPDASANELISIWNLERAATTKSLTASQIEQAFGLDLLDQQTATGMLVNEGYAAHDAWLLLSIRKKQALPNEPA